MKCLLDTNVVSEWVRPRPDSNVVAWLDGADEDSTFLSVATLATGPREASQQGNHRLAAASVI